jgi:hypothetical protein
MVITMPPPGSARAPAGIIAFAPLKPVVMVMFIMPLDTSDLTYLSGISSSISTSVWLWKLPTLRCMLACTLNVFSESSRLLPMALRVAARISAALPS